MRPEWSHLEVSEYPRKRKGENAKLIDFLDTCLNDVGLLAASWGGSVVARSRLGAVLGPFGAYWKQYSGMLRYLGPSWTSSWDL
eukprot:2688082-Pyramimonas_sp.AAC.1